MEGARAGVGRTSQGINGQFDSALGVGSVPSLGFQQGLISGLCWDGLLVWKSSGGIGLGWVRFVRGVCCEFQGSYGGNVGES